MMGEKTFIKEKKSLGLLSLYIIKNIYMNKTGLVEFCLKYLKKTRFQENVYRRFELADERRRTS